MTGTITITENGITIPVNYETGEIVGETPFTEFTWIWNNETHKRRYHTDRIQAVIQLLRYEIFLMTRISNG